MMVVTPQARPGRAPGPMLRQFVRSPLRTASIVPSSAALAELMTAPRHQTARQVGHRKIVVELGPGTGAFTALLQQRAHPGDWHLAIEVNPRMSAHMKAAYPDVDVVTAPASHLQRILDERSIDGADLIVSGLPWQAFSGAIGRRLIETIAAALAPGGVYTQFTYSWTRWAPPATRQLHEIRAAFERVDTSPTLWRNVPPAFVHTASRPRHRSSMI